jgi:orotate phosphoribosyltransferase
MDQDAVLQLLQDVGAFRAGHFVFTSGLHADTYINKDAIYPHVGDVSRLCEEMAQRFQDENVEVVIGPAYGAIILSTWTAHHLTKLLNREVLGVYADKGAEKTFIIRRGYDRLISGKRTLIVEDLTTTGGSIKRMVEAAQGAGANVVGAIAIANRGNVTPEQVGNPPRFEALVDLALNQWPEEKCILCERGIPVNTDIGHGAEFLKKKGML